MSMSFAGGYIVIFKEPKGSKKAWDSMTLEEWAKMSAKDRDMIAQNQENNGLRSMAGPGVGDGPRDGHSV